MACPLFLSTYPAISAYEPRYSPTSTRFPRSTCLTSSFVVIFHLRLCRKHKRPRGAHAVSSHPAAATTGSIRSALRLIAVFVSLFVSLAVEVVDNELPYCGFDSCTVQNF